MLPLVLSDCTVQPRSGAQKASAIRKMRFFIWPLTLEVWEPSQLVGNESLLTEKLANRYDMWCFFGKQLKKIAVTAKMQDT